MADQGVGVPQIDRLIAPIPDHATLVFVNDPGVAPEPFLYQAAARRLAEGGTVVYAVTNRSPASVAKSLLEFGCDVTAHEGRILWLDGFSALMGMGSEAQYVATSPGNVEEFATLLDRAGREHGDALLVVDTLSQLIDQASWERFAAVFPRIHLAMKRFAMAEVGFTKWPYSGDLDALLSSFDGVVTLRGVEDRIMLSQYFRVERAAWRNDLDARPRLYKSIQPGGVHVYIPKIVVTGPYNAGKSSFIHTVSDTAVSVDHLGTTVALDHARVTMDGLTADVFGTPGQSRFDPILKIVAGQALGVIVVVDSTKPDSFARAREMMHLTWRQGIPGIVAANKQDLPDALSPEEVGRLLSAPPTVRIVGCTGQDRDSSRRVLRELIDQIMNVGVAR